MDEDQKDSNGSGEHNVSQCNGHVGEEEKEEDALDDSDKTFSDDLDLEI